METKLHGRIPRRYAIALKRQQLQGLSHLSLHQASETLDVSRTTVRKWRRRLHNPDYLNIKSPRGRQWLLPQDARQWLTDLVGQPATLYGWDDLMWTARKVQAMIERKYDIKLSRVTAWNYLRRSNLTPQKPGTLYREQDPAKKAEWLQHTYPAILAEATQRNALIFFQDESAVAYSPPVKNAPGAPKVRLHNFASLPSAVVSW
jgi:transposase